MKNQLDRIHDGSPAPGLVRLKQRILSGMERSISLGLVASLLVAFGSAASAADLYYNRAGNPNWFGTTPWSTTGTSGPFNQSWTDGNTAIFGSGTAVTVLLNNNVAVAGLTNLGASEVALDSSGGLRTLTFSGGTMTGNFSLNTLTITGNLTQASGNINWGGATSAYSGTYTSAGGILDIGQSTRLGSNSNFGITGGAVRLGLNSATPVMGAVSMSAGSLRIGRFTGAFVFNLSISELSGTGGTIGNQGNSDVSNPTNTLTINQATNTTFSGVINGAFQGNNDRLALVKSGSGTLTLSGPISNMVRGTTVSGGVLNLTGTAAKSFGNTLTSTAIQVNSNATLGVTGTVTTLAGTSIIIASGGTLAAGISGTAGLSTYAIGTGGAGYQCDQSRGSGF